MNVKQLKRRRSEARVTWFETATSLWTSSPTTLWWFTSTVTSGTLWSTLTETTGASTITSGWWAAADDSSSSVGTCCAALYNINNQQSTHTIERSCPLCFMRANKLVAISDHDNVELKLGPDTLHFIISYTSAWNHQRCTKLLVIYIALSSTAVHQ